MAFNQPFGQRPPGPGRGPRTGGAGPRTGPMPKALEAFKLALSQRVGFADDRIMALAEDLAGELEGGFGSDSGRTQVRKLYGEFQALRKKAKAGSDFRPELRLIQAHVAYAVARRALTPHFKVFADEAVKRLIEAGDVEELVRFVRFFEALYAHFYHFSKLSRKEG